MKLKTKKSIPWPDMDKIQDAATKIFGEDLGNLLVKTFRDIYDDLNNLSDAALMLISFGDSAANNASRYLKVGNNGVLQTSTIGWRAIRAGSIRGASVQMDCSNAGTSGTLELVVRKNGVDQFSFPITPSVASIGNQVTCEKYVYPFSAGDIIQCYLEHGGSVNPTTNLVCALVEIDGNT